MNASLEVDVQIALDDAERDEPPSAELLAEWANTAYREVGDADSELTIRLVELDEITELNSLYRHQHKATNVLSFPFDAGPELDIPLLGDVVICHNVILDEAAHQGKNVNEHYAHMVTHGVLHLCGYDHQNDETAEQMEALETHILAQSGIANPYL